MGNSVHPHVYTDILYVCKKCQSPFALHSALVISSAVGIVCTRADNCTTGPPTTAYSVSGETLLVVHPLVCRVCCQYVGAFLVFRRPTDFVSVFFIRHSMLSEVSVASLGIVHRLS